MQADYLKAYRCQPPAIGNVVSFRFVSVVVLGSLDYEWSRICPHILHKFSTNLKHFMDSSVVRFGHVGCLRPKGGKRQRGKQIGQVLDAKFVCRLGEGFHGKGDIRFNPSNSVTINDFGLDEAESFGSTFHLREPALVG